LHFFPTLVNETPKAFVEQLLTGIAPIFRIRLCFIVKLNADFRI